MEYWKFIIIKSSKYRTWSYDLVECQKIGIQPYIYHCRVTVINTHFSHRPEQSCSFNHNRQQKSHLFMNCDFQGFSDVSNALKIAPCET